MEKTVALLLISTGKDYWKYIDPLIESAKKYFLKKHKVDFILWTDNKDQHGAQIIPTEHLGNPFATLMRYHLFLGKEELLKKYDYLFFIDIDMLFVNDVGDEILGEGITATQHPGYAYKSYEDMEAVERIWFMPFERNEQSSAFVRVPKYYFAGGFQGGKTDKFIEAMWSMKRTIDQDFSMNYRARWNDESHWNRWCFENPPETILTPEYCYPVGLPTPTEPPYKTHPMYLKIWGRDYKPKILCLTKEFQLSKEGGQIMSDVTKKLYES